MSCKKDFLKNFSKISKKTNVLESTGILLWIFQNFKENYFAEKTTNTASKREKTEGVSWTREKKWRKALNLLKKVILLLTEVVAQKYSTKELFLKNNSRWNICDGDLLELSCRPANLHKRTPVWFFEFSKLSRKFFLACHWKSYIRLFVLRLHHHLLSAHF